MNGEHVGQVAIVIFGPNVLVVLGIDQLHVDAHTIANASHAAFQNCGDAERFSNFTNVWGLSAICHDRRARDDLQIANLRQIGEHIVLNAIGEVGVLFIVAQILERQDGDRLVDLSSGRNAGEEEKSRNRRGHHAGCDKHDYVSTAVRSWRSYARRRSDAFRGYIESPRKNERDWKTDE